MESMSKLIDLLCKAVCEKFPDDITRPGLVLAYLKVEKRWYVSVVRYGAGGSRTVVYCAKMTRLNDALKALAKSVVGEVESTEALRAYVKGVRK